MTGVQTCALPIYKVLGEVDFIEKRAMELYKTDQENSANGTTTQL